MSFNRAIPKLPPQFRGKWNQKTYHVLRELGRGANGAVYLVSQDGVRRAVKIGAEGMDILMEVHALKSVQQGRDARVTVAPLLCDVDDLYIDGRSCTFYAMEYLDGEQLDQFVQRTGTDWVPVLIIQLLARLAVLHQRGWVFGDLKPENVIVTRADSQVRLIDFGGVTKHGCAVRQFTEEYDRAAWHAGDRRAEPAYDLFSLAVMTVRLASSPEVWKSSRTEPRQTSLLCDIIRNNDSLYPFRVPLIKAFHGQYAGAEEMKSDMLAIVQGRTTAVQQKKASGSGSSGIWIGGLFVASMLLLAGTLYYAWMM
ncbi:MULTISPECIES: serine/threonine protein kinase [Brevibacillus]|jgi:serine/threonine-protein kinase|uniref:Serine/threonine-protein kinase n=1 Tax=Brevibacillus borstelensis AK1 TaxID=1300222 RepID=M8DCD7_9BACL|nr:serine/threonine protein kinase [Brevibacillus borstelensis]EMT51078.1 serine/threonine-protein kinase [Brevibacillus borstelensis AK1]MCC0566177.1 serine/threonine protein kinase [Brevibacillus borstelensis]MCM3472670.1 serine/threonine protein kinase [Brevibacillus borstelensis]MCM3560548.1 serine/threonine protein kinase [Brevibacillus borstelensis]MCM3592692.1 serine/threonine protein kinase [Brevibacillus borstelensis]